MKFAIIGAGAMGSIFAAALNEVGYEVVLVDVVKPLVEKINADGLTIVHVSGEQRTVQVRATTNPSEVGRADCVAFFVKCYHTGAAAELARPLTDQRTVIASLQNGWGNGELLEQRFGSERLVVGVTYNSGTVLELGKVAHTNAAETSIGPYVGSQLAEADVIGACLTNAGFDVAVSSDIRTEIWKKLVLNTAALPPAALTTLSSGAMGAYQPVLELIDDIALETVRVARAAGYDIDPAERVDSINALLARAGAGKASMLQDTEARRRTEVDVINGAVVRTAEEYDIDAPLNRAMVRLIKGLERSWEVS